MTPTVKEFRATIKNFLSGKAAKKDLEQLLEDKPGKNLPLPTLAVASLTEHQVQEMLRLTNTAEVDEDLQAPSMPLGIELTNVMTRVDRNVHPSDMSEAKIRISLNMLLIYAVDLVRFGAPPAHPPSPQSLRLKPESTWSYGPAKGDPTMKCNLLGRPDYGVWYGEVEETAVNVVVVEAKRVGHSSSGVAQCLAYMGMVHRLRKQANKQDCSVFGMSTDGAVFFCLKINNKSEWSQRVILAGTAGYGQVFGLLVHFLRKASKMSPTHSKESSRQSHKKEGSGGSTSTIYSQGEDVVMQ